MQRHLERELDELRTLLIRMGSLVDEQIEFGIKAILESNVELARIVMERDRKVDSYDNQIDSQCVKIFALTHPVAIDLRLLMAALKINNELERIGDIAVNLAERVEPLAEHSDFLKKTVIGTMSHAARAMVRDAIDSFINNDPTLARKILEADDNIDALDEKVFEEMINAMKNDSALIEPASHTIILSRHIERLADHATNIAEDVIFLVNAKIIKHHAEGTEHLK
jgi:phosphate transport system protein